MQSYGKAWTVRNLQSMYDIKNMFKGQHDKTQKIIE